MSATNWVLRWLLLACTVTGLAAMHTLGHSGSHSGGHHGAGVSDRFATGPAGRPDAHRADATAAPTATRFATVSAIVAGFTAEDGCTGGGGCAHAGRMPEPGRPDMSGWSVCLAVLAGLSIALLLALMLMGRAAAAGGEAPRSMKARLGEPRAPPWPRFGLQVVSVSVMRT